MISPRYAQARLAADPCAEYDAGDFADALVSEVIDRTGKPDHFCLEGFRDSLSCVAEALESRLGRTECRTMVRDGSAIEDIAIELAAAVNEAACAAEQAYASGVQAGAEEVSSDVWQEGYEEGESAGHGQGYEEGYNEGFDEGKDSNSSALCPTCYGPVQDLVCQHCCRHYTLTEEKE